MGPRGPSLQTCWNLFELCVFPLLLHHAPTQYLARAARQWIPPSIPPEQLAAKYPARAARQWIPQSVPPELPASGSRRVSRQSGPPVDPAQYPARAAPVDPAEYPVRAAGQWIPPIPPERLASKSYPARDARQWIPPSIPPAECPAGAADR